jgi:Fe-S cluster biosynthesis and repair protein YggX
MHPRRFFKGIKKMTERLVVCSKFKQELPGLEKAPFGGEIGKLIFDKVSAQAWKLWKEDMQIKVLNEYRLNMADKNDYQKLVDQMLLFLNLKEGSVVEVENAERGRK